MEIYMKTTTKIMRFFITAVLALSTPLVYADNGNGGNLAGGQPTVTEAQSSSGQGDHDWKQGHHRLDRLFRKLHLTDDQKKQMKDIGQKQREIMKSNHEQIKANKESLRQELMATAPDMNKVNNLQAQLKTLEAQKVDNRLNTTLEVKKILTPEQFGKYIHFQHRCGRKHNHHHKHF
jgi:Spy/CpxP family protein refolding chaperone